MCVRGREREIVESFYGRCYFGYARFVCENSWNIAFEIAALMKIRAIFYIWRSLEFQILAETHELYAFVLIRVRNAFTDIKAHMVIIVVIYLNF